MTDTNIVDTINVDIYVGLKEGYDGEQHGFEELEDLLQEMCNEDPICVCVIPCSYVYKGGKENGAVIRLINYPRFPSNQRLLKERAIKMAESLKLHFKQNRISVQAPDMTYMIGATI